MADQVRNADKDLFDRRQDAWTHVVDHRQGKAIATLDFLQEGDDLDGFLRRHFHIAQHEFRKRGQLGVVWAMLRFLWGSAAN